MVEQEAVKAAEKQRDVERRAPQPAEAEEGHVLSGRQGWWRGHGAPQTGVPWVVRSEARVPSVNYSPMEETPMKACQQCGENNHKRKDTVEHQPRGQAVLHHGKGPVG